MIVFHLGQSTRRLGSAQVALSEYLIERSVRGASCLRQVAPCKFWAQDIICKLLRNCLERIALRKCSAQVVLHVSGKFSAQRCSVPVALRKLPAQWPYASCAAPIAQRTLLCASYSAQVSLRKCLCTSLCASCAAQVCTASACASLFCASCDFRGMHFACYLCSRSCGNTLPVLLLYFRVATFPRTQRG